MEMAKYIYSILKVDIMIMFSWGFNHPTAIENGLQFKVNGFKHKGTVKVVYNEGTDLFDVTFINRRGVEVEAVERVYIDSLVNVIDYHVEKTVNYSQDVEEWLNTAV